MKNEPKVGYRLREPPKHVFHSNLERFSEESAYRSTCPECKTGVLMVGRDQKTLELIRYDRCTFCAQAFIYEDEKIAQEIPIPLPEGFLAKLEEFARAAHLN